MGFLGRLKRGLKAFNAASQATGGTDIALGQLAQGAPILSTVEQLQFFKDSGTDISVSVMKDGTQIRRIWPVAEIDPLRYGIDLAEEYGGGRFQLKYSIAGKDVKRNNGMQVINYLDMASLPGETRLKGIQQKGEAAKIAVQTSFINPQVMEFMKFMREMDANRKPDMSLTEMVDVMVKLRAEATNSGGNDPLAIFDKGFERATQMLAAATPPITNAPGGGVFGGNMLSQIAKGLGEAGLGVLLGGNGQDTAPGAAPAEAIPQSVPPAAAAPPTPTGLAPEGFIQFLTEKFREQIDPRQMAHYCIQGMDNMATYTPDKSPQAWRQLDQNPGGAFDILTTLLPPHNVPEYVRQVRELVIGYFVQQEEQTFEESEPEPEPEPPADIEQFTEAANVESSDNQQQPPEPEPATSEQSAGVESEGTGDHEGPGQTG